MLVRKQPNCRWQFLSHWYSPPQQRQDVATTEKGKCTVQKQKEVFLWSLSKIQRSMQSANLSEKKAFQSVSTVKANFCSMTNVASCCLAIFSPESNSLPGPHLFLNCYITDFPLPCGQLNHRLANFKRSETEGYTADNLYCIVRSATNGQMNVNARNLYLEDLIFIRHQLQDQKCLLKFPRSSRRVVDMWYGLSPSMRIAFAKTDPPWPPMTIQSNAGSEGWRSSTIMTRTATTRLVCSPQLTASRGLKIVFCCFLSSRWQTDCNKTLLAVPMRCPATQHNVCGKKNFNAAWGNK